MSFRKNFTRTPKNRTSTNNKHDKMSRALRAGSEKWADPTSNKKDTSTRHKKKGSFKRKPSPGQKHYKTPRAPRLNPYNEIDEMRAGDDEAERDIRNEFLKSEQAVYGFLEQSQAARDEGFIPPSPAYYPYYPPRHPPTLGGFLTQHQRVILRVSS